MSTGKKFLRLVNRLVIRPFTVDVSGDRSLLATDLGKTLYSPTAANLSLPYPIPDNWVGRRFRCSSTISLAGYPAKTALGDTVSGVIFENGYYVVEILDGEYRIASEKQGIYRKRAIEPDGVGAGRFIEADYRGDLILVSADSGSARGVGNYLSGFTLYLLNLTGGSIDVSLAPRSYETITSSSQPDVGTVVAIGDRSYTFVASAASPGEVSLGASYLDNLADEINGDGIGTANTEVTATVDGSDIHIDAIVLGSAGDAHDCYVVSGSWSGATFEFGVDTLQGGFNITVNAVANGVITVPARSQILVNAHSTNNLWTVSSPAPTVTP